MIDDSGRIVLSDEESESQWQRNDYKVMTNIYKVFFPEKLSLSDCMQIRNIDPFPFVCAPNFSRLSF